MKAPTTERPDRRRERTRKQFFDAVRALIAERGYDGLTIQEIADRAGLSRATFYLHFRDKDDLLITGLRGVYDALAASMPPFTLADLLPDGRPPSLIVFQQIADDRALYRTLIASEAGATLQFRLHSYVAVLMREQFTAFMAEAGIAQPPHPLDLLVTHMAFSITAMMNWWLEDDARAAIPPEAMAAIFHQFNVHAWLSALGINPSGAGG